MVEEGKPAPDFELHSDAGETVKLSELRGQPVVLYFYPKDARGQLIEVTRPDRRFLRCCEKPARIVRLLSLKDGCLRHGSPCPHWRPSPQPIEDARSEIHVYVHRAWPRQH